MGLQLAVSGGQGFLRRRFLRNVVSTKKASGWSVVEVEGGNPYALREAMEGDPFGSSKTLVVVSQPEKVELGVLEGHAASGDTSVVLFLHVEGEPDGRTRFAKYLKELGANHKSFPEPKSWEASKVAVEFIQEEVKRLGSPALEPSLAEAWVQRVGSDLGVLFFEVEKAVLLSEGVALTPDHIKGAMAPVAEASLIPVSDALGVKNVSRLVRSLDFLRQTSKTDPTMRVCRFLEPLVYKWLQAVHLDALPPAAAAQELGVNPWYFENKVLPMARRWGKQGTVRLVSDLAAGERAVLNGLVDPWVVLSARLVASCQTG